MRMEEFAELPHNVKLAYIASEEVEDEYPCNPSGRLANVYIKTKK